MAFAPHMSPETTVVSLRAPHPHGPGYAWFDVQWTAEGVVIDPDEALDSRDRLVDEVSALQAEFSPAQTILVGFSQGAMMSLGVASSAPNQINGVVMMSGRKVDEFFDGAKPGFHAVPFLVQHGRYDEVLTFESGKEVAEALKANGNPTEFRAYPMSHEVSMQSLSEALAWIRTISSSK